MIKKTYLFGIVMVFTILIQACATRTATGPAPIKRSNIVGNWVLDKVSYEGISQSSIQRIFSDQAPACFEGSVWNLTNSGNGTYTIYGGNNCTAVVQSIFWSASPADDTFQFKKLEVGQKAAQVTDGYRLVLISASKEMLVLKSPVESATGSAFVVLTFSKAAK